MSLPVLDFESDLPAELWTSNDSAWCFRAEQNSRTFFDWKLRWLDCEPAGPQMRAHP